MTRLEQHIDRLLSLGRIFLSRGAELSAVVESAADAEVDIDVKWTNHGWWVVLQ